MCKIRLSVFSLLFLLTGCQGGGFWQNKTSAIMNARNEVYSVHAEPRNIVLMLSLSGALAPSSYAIRNGFLAAYHHKRKERPGIDLRIVDTTGGDLGALYKQAVQDGAEIIVGPLTKQEVELMVRLSPLAVPTIALNTLDDYGNKFGVNLYQFGLLPQDEAIQIAEKMQQQNKHDRIALIVPDSIDDDQRVAVFTRYYNKNGGQIVATLRYNSFTQLSQELCPFLAEDATKMCVPPPKKDKKTATPEEPPIRRQDINAIFLVAPAAIARRIVPLLKFYYAGDLPVYAFSSVYTGNVVGRDDRDLDGVYFCDMPWVLEDLKVMPIDWQIIYNHINSLWRSSFTRYRRLYALGIDAYDLALGFYRFLHALPEGFDGTTGKLYLDAYNHVYRKLQWARIRNGHIVLQ